MKQTQLIMGMPVTVEIVGGNAGALSEVFEYFRQVDARYSTYKDDSEISQINRGLPLEQWSQEMKDVLELCRQTKAETDGYFDIERDGQIDPSGLVKGWAINNAAKLLLGRGFENFFIDAGGDIQVHGINSADKVWQIGVRNPFNREEIIKTIRISDQGVATSGTAIRGQHIYDPTQPAKSINEITSLTVIGPNIYEADRFATAGFAMGRSGIDFIESRPGLEGYLVDRTGVATLTTGFARYAHV